ncbi:NUDIX domain-containing protein [Microbacterium sp. Marseille-Q6965]|uniref:NUDIX hydrolase n=1 Tax=Microbacterium sp. Marseille-Q6965 TaxID=2965072 RepID=UPI0021B74660|nr:NUDIX domain-containing protein [Microbacterium sp. Marseille-Q6965]
MTERYSEAYAARHGRFAVIPAAYVFLRRGDEVLLQLRAGTGYYDGHWAAGAAGHVERGETVLQAASREALEELGVVIDPSALVFLTVEHRTGDGAAIDERVDFFFACDRWNGEPSLQEDKAAELQWFPLGGLPDPVVPHERLVLDRLRDGGLDPVTPVGF